MPANKYQCLANALATGGVKLAPLMPGTDASEQVALKGPKDQKEEDAISFTFQDPTGVHFSVDGRTFSLKSTEGAAGRYSEYLYQPEDEMQMSSEGIEHRETGRSYTKGQPPKAGSIPTIVDKVLKCRDHKIP